MKAWLSLSPLGYLKRVISYRSIKVADVIQRNISNIGTPTHPSNGKIAIPELDIVIDPFKNEDILKVSTQLVSLKRRQNATFNLTPNGELLVQVNGIKIVAETIQDILCICEVYDSWIYALDFSSPVTVWDVGANIGTASLFFAGCRGWNVLAYEPFPKTAEAARANISLNGLEDKIQLFEAGLAGSSRFAAVDYSHDWRASNGIFGNYHPDLADKGHTVEIKVLDAAQEFQKVKAKAGTGIIVAKIDCEGSEYEILRRLRETGDLTRIDVMILEVHPIPNEDAKEPVNILIESGMSILRREMPSDGYQTVYAARLAHSQD